MIAALIRLLIRAIPWLSYDYRHRGTKPVQRCPACWNRVRVAMRYDPLSKLVRCECPTCSAQWGYNPVVQPAKWSRLASEE